LNLLELLRKCEPKVAQIAVDAGVDRIAVYQWVNGRMPREVVFNRLKKMDKYKSEMEKLSYKGLRSNKPLGRRMGSVKG
jgi:hypothetical protein